MMLRRRLIVLSGILVVELLVPSGKNMSSFVRRDGLSADLNGKLVLNLAKAVSKIITEKLKEKEGMEMILDSGNRREFETGAVRDIQEGKGRCDLLPLDVIGSYYANSDSVSDDSNPQSWVFFHLTRFVNDGQIGHLRKALNKCRIFPDDQTMFLEVSKHFEEGCKKYGENNWQKGIPTHCYIDSAVRHYLKYLRGDQDERHDRAFCWNILCCIWTCAHKPELNDYVRKTVYRKESLTAKELEKVKKAWNLEGLSAEESKEKFEKTVQNCNHCISCGSIIPEGRMVCPICEGKESRK